MYRHILVVTGDQPWVDAPIEYAIALAADTGAELSILTVLLPPLIVGLPDVTCCSPLVLDSVVAQHQTVLESAAALAEQAGVVYTTHVRWGNTADTILHTATENDCDLIILGSSACTWRGRRLLRYVTKKLTACARQPLLVVTEPPQEAYRGAQWSRLLVVHDGSPGGEAALHYALALAQEEALDVCLLHVNALRQHYDIDPLSGVYGVQDTLTSAETRTAIAGISHEVVHAMGDPVAAIVDTATTRECEVIVLGAAHFGWKRLLYRHMAREVMANTTRPVLLVNPLAASRY
jgi:nucleotide-binding universal stress UspA family protein